MSCEAVAEFERAFAESLGAGRAWAFWKGRVALYAILRALNVAEGDEIILPGYTCVMDVNPILYLGARPVYVDIEPITYNLRPDLVARAVTPRTRAIIAQHTYGYPCEMDALADIARKGGIPIIEDCCLALGSTYKGKLCGTFGLAAYWSFQWNKPFTTGVGGMATTADTELGGRIEDLCRRELAPVPAATAAMLAAQRLAHRTLVWPSTTGPATRAFRWLTRRGAVIGSSAPAEFQPTMPEGFFMGMSPGQARAGRRHLRRLAGNLEHRRRLRRLYDDLLARSGWRVPELPAHMDPVLVRYPVRVADKAQAVAQAERHGVELGTWFECPLHPIETPLAQYGYQAGSCPVSEQACRQVVNLPMHLRASPRVAERSVALLRTIGPPPAGGGEGGQGQP